MSIERPYESADGAISGIAPGRSSGVGSWRRRLAAV